MGSEGELRDALTNLIFNAVDAMPDGGTLTLRTRLLTSGSRGADDAARHVHVESRRFRNRDGRGDPASLS